MASWRRRVKAAGLDRETPPGDIDAMRYAIARKISMFLDTSRGCPEPLCRRHRGCMAPNYRCSNAPDPVGPQDDGRNLQRLLAMVRKAVEAADAAALTSPSSSSPASRPRGGRSRS